ncbi:hypothetical protein CMI37_12780 [Candidatus Pacearchaeota archaeon]|nr:hypothetical protein [Candidatus Pacearchaeota archaeon]
MPTAPDYTKMWEAWASGWGSTAELSQQTPIDDRRIIDFYSEVVGPAWGGGEDFGQEYEQYISEFSTKDFESAERQFKLAIGDPYIYGEDPFSWERVSRMIKDPVTGKHQAQTQLEAELVGQGKELGGEYGSEYSISMSKDLEAYTTGLTGTREGLTYEGLEGAQGLASGTSGIVLRSGQGETAAEDTLIEAYKNAKDMQAGYKEGVATTEVQLEENLNDALTIYLDALNEEKQDWFDIIGKDVRTASYTGFYEFGKEDISQQWGEDTYTTGLEYSEDSEWTLDEACGVGFVKQKVNGVVDCVEEKGLGLIEDVYGRLCPSLVVDECNECRPEGPENIDTWNSSCADECGVPNGDGMPEGACDCEGNVEDCAGVCGGNDEIDECGECGGHGIDTFSGYCDCNGNKAGCDGVCGSGAVEDECGECGGPGAQYLCPQDGALVCSESECEYETMPNCPPGTEWNGTYSNDLGNMCDFIGDIECRDGFELNEDTMECEPIGEYSEEDMVEDVQVTCWDGSTVTGYNAYDYSNCPEQGETPCQDGTLPSENLGYTCPEDQSEWCYCYQILGEWSEGQQKRCEEVHGVEEDWGETALADPSCQRPLTYIWHCPDQSKHGEPCGGDDDESGTGIGGTGIG